MLQEGRMRLIDKVGLVTRATTLGQGSRWGSLRSAQVGTLAIDPAMCDQTIAMIAATSVTLAPPADVSCGGDMKPSVAQRFGPPTLLVHNIALIAVRDDRQNAMRA
jgi:hypothetical protein